MEKFEHEYGAEQIQVLEGLEAVRKRDVYKRQIWTSSGKEELIP